MFGTGQNRSFRRGVRLSRAFVRRGSTVFASFELAYLRSLSYGVLENESEYLVLYQNWIRTVLQNFICLDLHDPKEPD